MIFRHCICSSRSPRAPLTTRRWISTTSLEGLARPVQSYISTSRDPFLNLSIEHFLLQKTDPESAVLFLYVNRPSIVIGRNQNPWLEVNLALLNISNGLPESDPPGLGVVDLVRRRSGGGTVFHDEGNVNWTVICPSTSFTRDKHAEMMVHALRRLGVDRARVNARHDIVLDQGQQGAETDPEDTHSTPYEANNFDTPRPLKVSGSAYKLTRGRALHHGTCLLSSPNLNAIPHYLHSPAKPYMTARGVESVSSPVGNITLGNEDFISSVQARFAEKYNCSKQNPAIEVGEEWLDEDSVRKGYDELRSDAWTYLQTPQFTISTESDEGIDIDLELSVRYGAINGITVDTEAVPSEPDKGLLGLKLHEITSWDSSINDERALRQLQTSRRTRLVEWLEHKLPIIN
ncbi:related to lipoyltransferase [Ramularia collo-cygni]|uniref:Putative lipoate-protein ligase A n=1 Tax=Ramularia collo-cygni TaxID=112498 RepID=A0A2D3VLX2_9PEZI|nr:related to lipoyltransferase [Ramularia collo-cygni]CZT24719.1 related to lipoyltransferase [Ramularia collo-cygni]